MIRLRSLGVVCILAVAAACARGTDPDKCEVEIVRLPRKTAAPVTAKPQAKR